MQIKNIKEKLELAMGYISLIVIIGIVLSLCIYDLDELMTILEPVWHSYWLEPLTNAYAQIISLA